MPAFTYDKIEGAILITARAHSQSSSVFTLCVRLDIKDLFGANEESDVEKISTDGKCTPNEGPEMLTFKVTLSAKMYLFRSSREMQFRTCKL